MKPKVPWLPSEVRPGQRTDRCQACGHRALMPWTLKRDPERMVPIRTWICASCQRMEERDEVEDASSASVP